MNTNGDHTTHYSHDDIRRYWEGQMNAQERHAIEKAALEDPFLAEAIEGFATIAPQQVNSDLAELESRLKARAEQKTVPLYSNRRGWLRIAAAAMLLIGLATGGYFIFNSKQSSSPIAKNQETGKADSQQKLLPVVSTPDSGSLAKPTTEEQAESKASESTTKSNSESLANRAVPAPKKRIDSVHPGEAASDRQAEDAKKIASTKSPEKEVSVATIPPPASAGESRKDDDNHLRAETLSTRNLNAPNFLYHVFRGQVLSPSGQPVPFANINVPQTGNSFYTDARGNFKVVSGDSLLQVQVRSIGYASLNASLNSSLTSNQLMMRTGTPAGVLNEVVIVKPKTQNRRTAAPQATEGIAKAKKDVSTEEIPGAEPVDGWAAYNAYLSNNLRPPPESKNYISHGLVEISFVVDVHGKLTDFRIEKSLCRLCDNEAIRLVKEGPAWTLVGGNRSLRTFLSILF